MAQQNLDGAEVGAGVEHVSGAGVAEQVRVNQMFDAGTASGIAAQCTDGIVVQRLIPTLFRREQPVRRFAPAVVDPQTLQQGWGQRDGSCNTAPAFGDKEQPLLAVKGAPLQNAPV